jgi:hypothetical protein
MSFSDAIVSGGTKLDQEPLAVPWSLFRTRADFEFTELVVHDHISQDSIERHIHLHQQATKPSVTFKNAKEVEIMLNEADKLLTGVCSSSSLLTKCINSLIGQFEDVEISANLIHNGIPEV